MRVLLDAYEALGTLWWIEIDDAVAHTREVILKEMIIAYIQDFEKTYSRFREDSLLSQLNDTKYIEDAPDELIDMLQRSLRYEHMTNGVFSIAVGSALERFGYGLSGAVANDAATALPRGSEYLDITHRAVRLRDDVRLDLGGIGKAYLIERIAQLLVEHDVQAYVINGGGDIFIHSPAEEIVVDIEHPKNSSLSIVSIPITHAALCTSSPFKRAWLGPDHVQRTHLVHPQHTNAQAEQFQESATVYAPSIVDADVFATVCAILGSARWSDIQHIAPLFHADVMLCSTDGQIAASTFFQSFINQ